MRRRSLFQLELQELLDIYFDCDTLNNLYQKYGYHSQHFTKRLSRLGMSLGRSWSGFDMDDQQSSREHLFAVLLETRGNVKKTATIMGTTEQAIRMKMSRKKLAEPLRIALETGDLCD